MGGSCSAKHNMSTRCFLVNASTFKQVLSKFEKNEINILKLIFKDLASRNKDTVITKECFSDFFNMIGLWGELVFDNFDKKHNNIIDYEEFICGISFYIKCAQEEKIKNLFQLYDLNGEGTIMKDEFQQMLMNYPKDDIERLLDDQMFLTNQNIIKMHQEKEVRQVSKQNQDIQEMSGFSQSQFLGRTKIVTKFCTSPSPDAQVARTSGAGHDLERQLSKDISSKESGRMKDSGRIKDSRRMVRYNSIDMCFPNESMVAQNGVPMGGFGCTLKLQVDGKLVEMHRVNLNYLVKKYVNMVFANKIDGDKDFLSLSEFSVFVSQHPNVFNGLYRGFNYDLWGYEKELKRTRFIGMQKDLEGYLMKQSRKTKQLSQRYCELNQNFCMEFKSKSSKMPNKIICLDGLCVQEIFSTQDKKYGFMIFHKDKVYSSITYYCKDAEQFKAWTDKLQIYEKASITDHYSLMNKIGEGRFSIVYKGTSKKDKQEYAIKIIEKYKLTREERYMLSHEAEIMKLLNHSCICKLYETLETKTHLYIITELVNDGDLFDCIQKQRYLQEYDAALVMAQLFDTISYIHSIGIVHRDLKPENIMVVYQPDKISIKQVKIIDFGFANFLTNLAVNNEMCDTLCGTTNYLAPEVFEGKPINFKVDIFSLGVIMYKMLAGVLPFDSEYPDEVVGNIIEGKYSFDDHIWSSISSESKDLVMKLLQKDPNDRISLSEAMDHPWIQNRKNYKGQVRVRNEAPRLFF